MLDGAPEGYPGGPYDAMRDGAPEDCPEGLYHMKLDEAWLDRSGIVELAGAVPRGRGHEESTSDGDRVRRKGSGNG